MSNKQKPSSLILNDSQEESNKLKSRSEQKAEIKAN